MALIAIAAWGQSSPVTGSKQVTTLLTADQREAQKHFRLAQTAITDGNLDAALDELQKARELDPKNSSIWYDIAVVQSKRGLDSDALESLNRALNLGLPAKLKASAVDLHAKLAQTGKATKATPKQSDASYDDTVHYIQERVPGGFEEESHCNFVYHGWAVPTNVPFAELSPHVSWDGREVSIKCAGGKYCVRQNPRTTSFDFFIDKDASQQKMEKALLHLLDLCGVRPAAPDLF